MTVLLPNNPSFPDRMDSNTAPSIVETGYFRHSIILKEPLINFSDLG